MGRIALPEGNLIGKYLSQGRFRQVLGLDQDTCAVPAGTGARP